MAAFHEPGRGFPRSRRQRAIVAKTRFVLMIAVLVSVAGFGIANLVTRWWMP